MFFNIARIMFHDRPRRKQKADIFKVMDRPPNRDQFSSADVDAGFDAMAGTTATSRKNCTCASSNVFFIVLVVVSGGVLRR